MAPLAVLYKSIGWEVTGSDRAFFPPMSTYLEKNGIKIMPGFKKQHLSPGLDMVVVMAFLTEKNPEIVEARKMKIPVKVYADVLPGLIEKENSIVIAGDCGKTSTAALVTWLLETAGYNPSFMIGGLPKTSSTAYGKLPQSGRSWKAMNIRLQIGITRLDSCTTTPNILYLPMSAGTIWINFQARNCISIYLKNWLPRSRKTE